MVMLERYFEKKTTPVLIFCDFADEILSKSYCARKAKNADRQALYSRWTKAIKLHLFCVKDRPAAKRTHCRTEGTRAAQKRRVLSVRLPILRLFGLIPAQNMIY